VPDLVAGVLFLASGFLALKLFYLLGAQRVRSQWEWTTWSIVASLPINGIASLLRDRIAIVRGDPDGYEVALRLLIGIALGSTLAAAWQLVRASGRSEAARFRRAFGASAWDEALEDVQRDHRQVELVLDDGTKYAGTIGYGGREDNAAEGWLYLIYPEVFDTAIDDYREARGTHGILLHRDRIKRIRVFLRAHEATGTPVARPSAPNASDSPSAGAGQ